MIKALKPFTGEDTDPQVDNLFGSSHPFAKILHPSDLNSQNVFTVGRGFQIVCCTTMWLQHYEENLRISIPLPRMQPIFPRDKPY